MSTVQQLKEPSQLPDGLKALMAELQVPINDPIIPLLLWIWQQMTETKLVLDNARASTQAVFDNRLERLSKLAELMLSMEIALKEVRKTLETKPLQIKEQVEKELAVPLKGLADSYKQLDQQAKSLLQKIEAKVAPTEKGHDAALFASGFMGGILTALCIVHFLALL